MILVIHKCFGMSNSFTHNHNFAVQKFFSLHKPLQAKIVRALIKKLRKYFKRYSASMKIFC